MPPEAATAPAPTSTPAPAPAPAQPKPAAPAPAPAQPGAETPEFADFDAKLEARLAAKRDKPEPAEKPAKEPPEAEAKPPAEQPKPAPTKEDRTVEGPKALRDQLTKVNLELKAKQESITVMERRIADAESKGKDATALAERLATLEKQLNEKEGEVRALRHEVTPEFKVKYDEPFNLAAAQAEAEIKQLEVLDAEGNAVRKADWEKDFAGIYWLDRTEAKARAKALFGDEASLVLDHYTNLHRLDREKQMALQKERSSWAETEKQRVATEAQRRQATDKMYSDVTVGLVEKHAAWYGNDEKDPEGNEVLKDGLALADSYFSDLRKSLSPQDLVIAAARIRLRSAAFGRELLRNKRLTDEIEVLKSTIEEMRGSKPIPGGGRPSGADESGGDEDGDWKGELRTVLKDAR